MFDSNYALCSVTCRDVCVIIYDLLRIMIILRCNVTRAPRMNEDTCLGRSTMKIPIVTSV